jgi:hypothetical protein
MPENILSCGPDGWLAITSAVTILGLLALSAAALLKYLFTGSRHSATA